MVMRVSEGESAFNSEMQNEPINPDDCIFVQEWFEFYNEAEINFRDQVFQFFGFVDPSLGKTKKSDFSAIVTLAKHKTSGYMYVVDADIERRHPDRIITDVLEKEKWLRATFVRGYKKLAAELNVGDMTLRDIVKELEKPARDPREEMPRPILRTDVLEMKDLSPGMILKGTVRNVIDFGAFVDIGVHQDGLVHISQISDKFIKHPMEAVSVGDIVEVKVLSVDLAKKRIALTMKL